MTRLHQLHDRDGQRPWLDNLTRGDLTGGGPRRLVDQGIRPAPPAAPGPRGRGDHGMGLRSGGHSRVRVQVSLTPLLLAAD